MYSLDKTLIGCYASTKEINKNENEILFIIGFRIGELSDDIPQRKNLNVG